jgi:hypothetical protein
MLIDDLRALNGKLTIASDRIEFYVNATAWVLRTGQNPRERANAVARLANGHSHD